MDLLIIFVKHPEPGKVKTRLARTLGEAEAFRIYQLLLEHTRNAAEKTPATKVVFYGNTIPERDLWANAGYRRILQEGKDLGERMHRAFLWGFGQGFSRIVLIGSDCAQLGQETLNGAFEALAHHDLVLGPANDGGYFLIGMKTAFPEAFQEMPWSTSDVLQCTLAAAIGAEVSFFLLPECIDVDTEEDLKGTFLEKRLQDPSG